MEIGWIAAIFIGGLSGWVASMVLGANTGIVVNIILGVVGAAVANIVLGLVGVKFVGWFGYAVAGFIGAAVLIAVGRIIQQRR